MQKVHEFLSPFAKCGTPQSEVDNLFSVFVDAPRMTEIAKKVIQSRKANLERFIRKNVGSFGAIVTPDEVTVATMRKVISDYNRMDHGGKERLKKVAFLSSGVCWLLGNEDLMMVLRPKLQRSAAVAQKPARVRISDTVTIDALQVTSADQNSNSVPASTKLFVAPKIEGKTMNSFTSVPDPNSQAFRTVNKGYRGRWRA